MDKFRLEQKVYFKGKILEGRYRLGLKVIKGHQTLIYKVRIMVFNATFNNILVISWQCFNGGRNHST